MARASARWGCSWSASSEAGATFRGGCDVSFERRRSPPSRVCRDPCSTVKPYFGPSWCHVPMLPIDRGCACPLALLSHAPFTSLAYLYQIYTRALFIARPPARPRPHPPPRPQNACILYIVVCESPAAYAHGHPGTGHPVTLSGSYGSHGRYSFDPVIRVSLFFVVILLT